MINIELMSKLYLVVAHNLNEARKDRDGNKKKKNPRDSELLKVGDNVLVRDHTSRAFQPKYKDFCMTGLLGKNQIEIKDNHRHTTKVHCRDVKKIPMTEKVCQLCKEEQVGKVRQGKKAIPDSRMPDLGWDATEELETQDTVSTLIENTQEIETTVQILPDTIIAIAILILAFLETIKPQLQELLKIEKMAAQVVLLVTRTVSHNRFFKGITKICRKAVQVVTHVTRTTSCNSQTNTQRTANRNHAHTGNWTSK